MYSRQTLRDLSDLSIKQINDNFMAIFLKLSGNINSMDLGPDAVDTVNIIDGAVTGDKVLKGSIVIDNLEDGFVGKLDLLENPVFTSLASDVNGNSTLIQQNTNQITLQASKINGNTEELARLDIKSDKISASVSSVDKRVDSTNARVSLLEVSDKQIKAQVTSLETTTTGMKSSIASLEIKSNSITSTVETLSRDVDDMDRYYKSEIKQLDSEISSKVGYYDRDIGEWMVSEINQTPGRVTISADNIDLYGITSVYGSGGRTELQMSGSAMNLYSGRDRIMSIGLDSIAGAEYDAIRHVFYGYVDFKDGTSLDRYSRSNFTPMMEAYYEPNKNSVVIKDFGQEVGEIKVDKY